jgi:predicted CopG family antitoxin
MTRQIQVNDETYLALRERRDKAAQMKQKLVTFDDVITELLEEKRQ